MVVNSYLTLSTIYRLFAYAISINTVLVLLQKVTNICYCCLSIKHNAEQVDWGRVVKRRRREHERDEASDPTQDDDGGWVGVDIVCASTRNVPRAPTIRLKSTKASQNVSKQLTNCWSKRNCSLSLFLALNGRQSVNGNENNWFTVCISGKYTN